VNTDVLDGHAIARAAAIGLLLFVPLWTIPAVVVKEEHKFETSAWGLILTLAVFAIYAVVGFIAAKGIPSAPLANGMVAAITAFVLWIPIRIVIWAIRDTKGLFTGTDPVFTPARILGQIVFAAAFGAIGGWLLSRRVRHRGSVDA
jgi:hypothetical protein